MKIKLTQYVLVVYLTFITSSAFATTNYSDEATFSEALGDAPVILESFESVLDKGTETPSLVFATADVSCDGSSWCSNFFGVSPLMPTDGAMGVYFATPDSITFTFAAPITAFSIDVGGLGTKGATDFSATLSNGTETTFLTGYSGSSFDQLFIGVIDDSEFTSITFHGTIPDDGIYFDRMQTALAEIPAPIPEPSTYAMLITGLLLLGASAHRKKQKVSI